MTSLMMEGRVQKMETCFQLFSADKNWVFNNVKKSQNL